MSDRVTIAIVADTTEALAEIERFRAAADEAVGRAKEARKEIMTQVRSGLSAISQMMTSFSLAMHLIGANVDAFYGALIGMTLSTISMLISVATGLAATVIGIPASAIVFGIAATIQMITMEKLIFDKMHTEGIIEGLEKAVTKGVYTYRQVSGVQPVTGGF